VNENRKVDLNSGARSQAREVPMPQVTQLALPEFDMTLGDDLLSTEWQLGDE
jgi:hypothetical protein